MDPNELLKMLDLNGKPARPPNPASPITPVDARQPDCTPSRSLTALEVDEWGLRRGRDLVDESERLQNSGTDAFAAADFFTAAFEPAPRLAEGCADPRRHQFLAQLLDTPEYRALHVQTQLDDTAASIAAGHFAEQFSQLEKEDVREKPGGSPSTGNASGDTDLARAVSALRAVGRAVTEAEKEVSELHESAAALGMGPGEPGSNDPKAIAALFRRVRSNPHLKRICELAGRFRRVAQGKQRRKVRHGRDDVVGVEFGSDLGRLLPSELVKFVVPELELDTLRRLAERQLLCRQVRAVEPVGRGPVLVCADESGSMQGPKAHAAKALALALAWVARRQRRWVGLCAYSGDSGERLLALPPTRWDESAVCDWLTAFIGGGSDIDVPVRELPRMYREVGAPAGKTDVVMITDCQCRLPVAVRDAFNAWKTSVSARVLTLVVGDTPGDLGHVSDEIFRVSALDPSGDAIGRILSL